MREIKIEQHSLGGMLWISGWFFTVGFLQFGLMEGIIAIILWPYYLGTFFSLI